MDRRLLLTGLLGVAGTAGIAAVLPRPAHALTAGPLGSPALQPDSVLPDLTAPPEDMDEAEGLNELGELDEGVQLAHYPGRRRRRRVRRLRRRCRWRWINGHWRRRCRREPHWIYIWFWI
jgi:hypothetical protein